MASIDTAMRALNSLSSKIQANWSFWRTTPAQDSDLDDNHWSDPESPLPYSFDTVAGYKIYTEESGFRDCGYSKRFGWPMLQPLLCAVKQ